MKEVQIPLSEVRKLFKKFIQDEIEESDFSDNWACPHAIFKKWWQKKEISLKKKYNKK